MMDDNQMWWKIWRGVMVALTVMVACMSGCTIVQTAAVADMVAHGADPQAAACAFSTEYRNPVCVALAVKKQ